MLSEQLDAGIAALSLAVTAAQRDALLHYLALLERWNSTYNLTAIRDPREMVTRHLLDSLAIAPWIEAQRCIDVGTGAGLPGLPLAILYPDRAFDLLDSNGKKTRFLFQVKTALGLDNMVIYQERVESFRPEQPYGAVLSRAFASLHDMVSGARHLLAPGGRFLAMKGAIHVDELQALAAEPLAIEVHPLAVPGLDEERHLVEITAANERGETRRTQRAVQDGEPGQHT